MKKISSLYLYLLLDKYLGGITFFDYLLSQVTLSRDGECNVEEHVIDNIKLVLQGVIKRLQTKEPDSPHLSQYKLALKELLPYGSLLISSVVQQFLYLIENDPSQIGELDIEFPESVCSDNSEDVALEFSKLIDSFEIVINGGITKNFSKDAINN